MTDILKLAEQAGIDFQSHRGITGKLNTTTVGSLPISHIQRFYDLAIADYRASLLGASVEPVAYGYGDTQLGRNHRLMMVRLDQGQDGCTIPLYTADSLAARVAQMQAEIDRLQVRFDDVTSEEHSIPQLRAQLWESFDETKKAHFCIKQLQTANGNLIAERDALRDKMAQLEQLLRLALDSLQECEPRPDCFDFAPAYEGAVQRRNQAIAKLKAALPDAPR